MSETGRVVKLESNSVIKRRSVQDPMWAAYEIADLRRRLDGLKPYIRHDLDCAAFPREDILEARGGEWRDGDEATCTCGLAEALGLKEGGR